MVDLRRYFRDDFCHVTLLRQTLFFQSGQHADYVRIILAEQPDVDTLVSNTRMQIENHSWCYFSSWRSCRTIPWCAVRSVEFVVCASLDNGLA